MKEAAFGSDPVPFRQPHEGQQAVQLLRGICEPVRAPLTARLNPRAWYRNDGISHVDSAAGICLAG
jgi:hypothetical protein